MEGRYISDLPAIERRCQKQLRGEQVYFWLITLARLQFTMVGKAWWQLCVAVRSHFTHVRGAERKNRTSDQAVEPENPPPGTYILLQQGPTF